ncbi:methylthioadenosine phosphorylase [Hydrogenispora ethanolica]|jgi:5'-methylthioadenosine phosphorylase|uniref:Probable 6-oxopurine nucleoside phosphorylase n=1 Tax=Hydrogenispora ethanolica TaxID=1082276 RepID=A0A4R1REG3_HYDET|nr:S-methyl-5'-thioadenosine phosphorylase [Hydrogenispora ethanolica]TCL64291.1 methylthioadenosine phosphorylase [Hydrogenispora ethanolica]
MNEIKLAVIGGSGVYQPAMLDDVSEVAVETPYGEIRPMVGKIAGRQVAFLARHGREHSLLPHQLNYRANIWGLKSLGVERIIATTAVGSLREELAPGALVLVDQFLDFTKQRPLTFFESGEVHRAHIDVTEPYCPDLRRQLEGAATSAGIAVHSGGCYVCAEGPRYETAAEIRMYSQLGGAVVGMTGVPEVVLARELGICYAGVSMVTNWAAGISPIRLDHADVVQIMNEHGQKIVNLIIGCYQAIGAVSDCGCRRGSEGKE